jgi:cytochrome b561
MGLHWTIAALIIIQILLGWTMNELLPDHSPAQAWIERLHISLGLTTLILVLARIALRLSRGFPALPDTLRPWERALARTTHVLFYVLMLALPLTGWALVSARPPALSFWGLPWPRLPGLGSLAASRSARHVLQQVHTNYLIWIVLGDLLLHVAGAVKHQFDGRPVLWRMLPTAISRKP